MKKISTLVATLFMALAVFSQDCNIGNSDGTDPNFTPSNILPNYLVGVNFTISEVGVLHSLNMIGNGTGATFQMAIYDDNGGVPNNLVAYTNTSNVGTGLVTIPVTPVQLEAGDYWIMAVYKNDTSATNHSNVNYNDTSSVVYYTELTFGDSIPTNASAFETYSGQDFLYFAEISCGPLSVNDFEVNNFSIYPNPASIFITVGNIQENKTFEVYDLTGKKLIKKELSQENNNIDVSSLAVGVYLLKSGINSITKFVKE